MRKRSQSLGMSRETCRRVLVNDIRAYPYRIQTLQTLTASDKKQRSAMAIKMLEKIEGTPSFLNLLWTSDEAHFHLDEKVNSKTNVFWGSSRPNKVATKSLHLLSARRGLQSRPEASSDQSSSKNLAQQ